MKHIASIAALLILIQLSTAAEQCECGGLNEHYGVGSACDTTCATYGKGCRIQTFAPVKRCACNDGFARDEWGICVPISDCPK